MSLWEADMVVRLSPPLPGPAKGNAWHVDSGDTELALCCQEETDNVASNLFRYQTANKHLQLWGEGKMINLNNSSAWTTHAHTHQGNENFKLKQEMFHRSKLLCRSVVGHIYHIIIDNPNAHLCFEIQIHFFFFHLVEHYYSNEGRSHLH